MAIASKHQTFPGKDGQQLTIRPAQLAPILEPFSYEQVPLTEETRSTHIRLVSLTASDEVSSKFSYSFQLSSVALADNPKYEALSYTWGNSPATFPITLNGRQFHITPSLATALRYACPHGRTTPIWVDQISIDQRSAAEKNAQVPLMARIYRGAAEVRIWLGEAADGSDALMDAFAFAARKSRECGIEELLTRENFMRFNRWTAGTDQDDLPRRRPFSELCAEVIPLIKVETVKAFFARPWFHRVWTVQEFTLATASPRFICGDKAVLADDVKYAWIVYGKSSPILRLGEPMPEDPLVSSDSLDPRPEALARKRILLARQREWYERVLRLRALGDMDPLTPLTNIRKRAQMYDEGTGPGSSLFIVLTSLVKSARACTDPKDWIYGLLAFPNDAEKLSLVVEYGLSSEVVYTQFTRKTIENGNLEILRFSRYPKSVQTNYPSWVPDWVERPRPSDFDYADDSQILLRPGEPGFLFSASGTTKPSVIDMNDDRLLALRGYIVDEIEELGSPWGGVSLNIQHRMETLAFLSSIRLLCLLSATKNHSIYTTPERRQEAIWRIPIADLVRFIQPSSWQCNARATRAAEDGFRFVCEYEEGEQARHSPQPHGGLSAMLDREQENGAQQYRSAMNNLKNKRPYITKLGYVGLGPVFARPSDQVVVFKGAVIPYVIRPVEGGSCLLGESYCDGIMDGEILGQRDETTIVLA